MKRIFLPLIILLFVATNAAFSAECVQQDGYTIFRLRNCAHYDEHFKIPSKHVVACKAKEGFFNKMKDSDHSQLTFVVPPEDIGNNAPPDGIEVSLRSPAPEGKIYMCGGRVPATIIKDLLAHRQKGDLPHDKFLSLGEGKFKIAGVGRRMLGMVICDGSECRVKYFPLKKDEERQKYDVYYREAKDGTVRYEAQCIPWNGQCYVKGAGALVGGYDYEANFSLQYAEHIFTLMDIVEESIKKTFTPYD